MSIPGLDTWLETPQGRYITDWEQARLDLMLSDIFGFNALQIGMSQLDLLRTNRMALRQRIDLNGAAHLCCELAALPIASQSTDLVVLPHVLEFHAEPHQILREIERILIPDGQIIITGFNPLSLWGIRQRCRCDDKFPWNGNYLAHSRLRDWLQLLGFEVDRGEFGCYAPALTQEKWLRRWQPLEKAGPRWWRFSGAVYLLRAIKRTHGMRLITPKWKTRPVGARALRPVAQKEGHGR